MFLMLLLIKYSMLFVVLLLPPRFNKSPVPYAVSRYLEDANSRGERLGNIARSFGARHFVNSLI